MNILIIGDVVGSPGRGIMKRALPRVFRRWDIDYCIANVENAAGGFGVTREVCDEILAMGVDCMTSGNHIWDKREILPVIEQMPQLLRPANYPASQPGKGTHVGRGKDSRAPVATLNLSGRVFMNGAIDDPFTLADRLVEELRREARIVIVDMHAEATSEKNAIGHYLDGRVTAVVGTHTHVPTCDHRLLSKGTAYCTDLGMTGPYDSVIGVEASTILERFVTGMPKRFETAKGDPRFAAVVVDADPETGRARGIERMLLTEADVEAMGAR
ncbi:MAG TPA: TIGR00282 family metallophosphoesterase [Vicinamibacteria bacterium]|nr:TIGR00282 family metallophosphoesterase [Vicinamibacteria bacterium]